MNGDQKNDGPGGDLPVKYIEEAVFFVVNWHAATVNMRLYPPTSSMVTDTVEKARTHLEALFEQGDIFSVSVLESSILINDVRLEEIEQQKAPVKSFVHWMNERGLTNLEFTMGVTLEEMTTVFEVLSLASDKDHRQNLSDTLVDRGVENVTINQRVYVAISTGDDYSEGIRKASSLDALKDELLMRYLMGKVDLGQVEDRELVEVLSDQGKVGGLLSSFIMEEGSEGGILVRSQKAEEALNRLVEMVDQVEDESLRELLTDQIGGIIAEMTPREMTSMLTGDAPESLNIGHVRERVLTMMGDNQLLEMVDSLIDDYIEMKDETDELETEWQKEKLRSLNELLVEVREERGIDVGDAIDTKLEVAGIAEERDPETGGRVLSAYQLLGGPIDEEYVELAEGIDQTISQQIHRLYEMEEMDLAAGMLEKLADNLKQESPKVRRFAATLVRETLEAIEPEYQLVAGGALEPRLIEDLRSEQDYAAFVPQVDALAVLARAYMQEGMPGRATDIVELLQHQSGDESDKGPELVRHAAVVLEKLTGPEGMVDAQALLMDDDRQKRIDTARALASLGPSALAPLVDLVKDRGKIDLRERALEALQAAGPVGIEALLDELRSENPWYIYRNVLNVVAELGLVEAVEEVGAMVVHPDERIRREAVRSLARIGAQESVAVVMEAANDSSPAVRRTAVRVLGMFKDSSVAPFLTDIINARGPRGRDEDQAVVEASCLALGDLHDSAFIPGLAELLGKGGLFKKARPDEIRAAACIALGAIGDQSAAPLLERAKKDSSMMVRSSAEKALRKLTGEVTSPEPIEPPEVSGVKEAPPAQAGDREYQPPPHREAAAAEEEHAPPASAAPAAEPGREQVVASPAAVREAEPVREEPPPSPEQVEETAVPPAPEPVREEAPPSAEYLPPEIPPDDIYIDNLAGEEDILEIPQGRDEAPRELGPATIEGYAAAPPPSPEQVEETAVPPAPEPVREEMEPDWPMLDSEQAPYGEPAASRGEMPEQSPPPLEDDYGAGRLDQPSTIERILEEPEGAAAGGHEDLPQPDARPPGEEGPPAPPTYPPSGWK